MIADVSQSDVSYFNRTGTGKEAFLLAADTNRCERSFKRGVTSGNGLQKLPQRCRYRGVR